MHHAYSGWVNGFADIVGLGRPTAASPTRPSETGWRLTALVEGLGLVALVGLARWRSPRSATRALGWCRPQRAVFGHATAGSS
jgi:hypothetical protein